MPCRTDDYEPRVVHVQDPEQARQFLAMKGDLDTTTRLLCSVMTNIEGTIVGNSLLDSVEGLREWWGEHKEADKRRWTRDFEALMAKLSPDEREALEAKMAGKI